MINRAIQFLGAIIVLFLSAQSLYWPLVMNPGTPLAWWQVKWAAELGFRASAPAILLVMNSNFSSSMQEAFGWVCILAWSGAIYWAIGLILRQHIPGTNRAS